MGYTNTLHPYTGSIKTEKQQQCVFYRELVRSQEVPKSRNGSLGSAQGGLWKDFWWLGKSQYFSGTCEMGSPLPGDISLATGRGDMRYPLIYTCGYTSKPMLGSRLPQPLLYLKAQATLAGHSRSVLHRASSQPAAVHRPPFFLPVISLCNLPTHPARAVLYYYLFCYSDYSLCYLPASLGSQEIDSPGHV